MKGKTESRIRRCQWNHTKIWVGVEEWYGQYSVKGGRKIKKTQTSDLLLTHGSDNVVVYSK